MNDILPQIHIANRVYVDDYLDDPNITRVEALLRSIKPLSETKEPKLQEVANTVSSRQMARLRTNLSDMGHVIESQLDATTIAGGTRVETVSFFSLFFRIPTGLIWFILVDSSSDSSSFATSFRCHAFGKDNCS